MRDKERTVAAPILTGPPGAGKTSAMTDLGARLQRELGRSFFLIAATLESEADLRGVVEAAGADKTLVVCLRAAAATLAERLDAREPASWAGRQLLLEHARGLADRAPAIAGIDLVLDTDSLDRDEVVAEILGALAAAEIDAPPAAD